MAHVIGQADLEVSAVRRTHRKAQTSPVVAGLGRVGDLRVGEATEPSVPASHEPDVDKPRCVFVAQQAGEDPLDFVRGGGV